MATQGERLAATEVLVDEHERRLNGINGQIEGVRREQVRTNQHLSQFREDTGKQITALKVRVAMYAALGGLVGSGVVTLIVYLLVTKITGAHPSALAGTP